MYYTRVETKMQGVFVKKSKILYKYAKKYSPRWFFAENMNKYFKICIKGLEIA